MGVISRCRLLGGGELGSRSNSGAAPATVVELKHGNKTTGSQAWEGAVRSFGTAPEPGNQPLGT
jgi:hypothetical protein